MPNKETIMLRFTGGGSDKGYQVILEPQGDGWVVNDTADPELQPYEAVKK